MLGPLLFIMYINDLTLLPLAAGSKLSLFADDVILYWPVSVLLEYSKIQCDISVIEYWSNSNFLSLNPQKCKYTIVSRRHSPLLPSNALQLYGQSLSKVSLYKYLGVLLSSDMKWSSHIEVTCSKAKCILGLLYRRFYGLADCRTIIQLYLSIVSETTSGICQLLMGSSHIKGYHFIGRRAKVCMQNCYQALDSRIPTVARNLCNTLSGGAQNSTKVMSVVQHFVWSLLLSSRCFCVFLKSIFY